MSERARCPGCGRMVIIGVPRGGDGSADVFRTHRDQNGDRCSYSRDFATAPEVYGRTRRAVQNEPEEPST